MTSTSTPCFPPAILSPTLHSLLPPGFTLRPLSSLDHSLGHVTLLSVLTVCPDPGPQAWKAQFDLLAATKDTYYPLVVTENESGEIVAAGTIFLERKFIRNLGKVAHVEDIVVAERMQGKGLGKALILVLTRLSVELGAYKTILDCEPANEAFYKKCGYENKGFEMAKYNL